MSETGWKSPTVIIDDDSVGTTAWSNPDNAKASDDSYATSGSLDGVVSSHYLKATNFEFSIPKGSTINGVEVKIEQKYAGTPSTGDIKVKLVKGGVIVGDVSDIESISNVDDFATLGSSTDLWGATLTSTDINSSGFGCVYYIDNADGGFIIDIDHIQIKVYYTESGTPTVGTKYPLPPFKIT